MGRSAVVRLPQAIRMKNVNDCNLVKYYVKCVVGPTIFAEKYANEI